MSRLVVDPTSLKGQFPEASVSNTVRVRILCQVMEYDPNTSILSVNCIPNTRVSRIESADLKVNLFHILNSIKSDVVDMGAILNLNGFYDGQDVNVVECYPIDGGRLLGNDSLDVLGQLSQIKDLD